MKKKYGDYDIVIDAVIYWVDGNDRNWQQKLNKFAEVKIDFDNQIESVRYNNIDEIDIAIKSIIKFAPFVNNIFLVTDNQIPKSFKNLKNLSKKNGKNLVVVDHKVIFRGFEEYLPCFNSSSIESLLFRIPNLSEHFLIFNDDTFLMRLTKIEDFFINGFPVIRGVWKKYYEDQLYRKIYNSLISFFGINKETNSLGFKKYQQNSAKLVGASKYFRRFHTPIVIRKSTIESFFEGNNILENNIKYRFRNKNQFLLPTLSEHLEIRNNSYFYKKDTQLTYFRSYKNHLIVELKLILFSKNKRKLFMCFQSLETADEKTLNYILKWINNRLEL